MLAVKAEWCGRRAVRSTVHTHNETNLDYQRQRWSRDFSLGAEKTMVANHTPKTS